MLMHFFVYKTLYFASPVYDGKWLENVRVYVNFSEQLYELISDYVLYIP